MSAPTPPDDPLEPPAYEDAATEQERNRLRWAWRDGFEAGAAWHAAQFREDLAEIREALAEIKQAVAAVPAERPVPWREGSGR